MEKIKFYANLFGGTLEKILEYSGEVKNENLEKAIAFLDKLLKSKLRYKVTEEEKELVNWLNSKVLDDVIDCPHFWYMCEKRHIKMMKWMHKFCDVDLKGIGEWISICRESDMALALENSASNVTSKNNFEYACKYGHLDVAKCLYEFGIKTDFNRAFGFACSFGQIEVAKWLVELGKINIHYDDDYAFRWSYLNDHLDIAKWLFDLGGVDIHARRNHVIFVTHMKGEPLAVWFKD